MSIIEGKYGKSLYTGPVHLYGVYRAVTARMWELCLMVVNKKNLQYSITFRMKSIYLLKR